MKGYVELAKTGVIHTLSPPLDWELCYTTGVPCDSFHYICVWNVGDNAPLAQFARFIAKEGTKVVFYGVVDECQVRQSGTGSLLEISGRGMAGLLLDNEAYGRDYGVATLTDILKNHVEIHGIEVHVDCEVKSVRGFTVKSGTSDWSVLYDFCSYHGGVVPRFNRSGQLVISGVNDKKAIMIGQDAPLTERTYRYNRYGVPSEILVRNRHTQHHEILRNESFYELGGRCRRVMNSASMERFQGVKYDAQFRLDKESGSLVSIAIEIATWFDISVGELLDISRSDWDWNGIYRVVEVVVSGDRGGLCTRLELAMPSVMS